MPRYDMSCDSCDYTFEVRKSFSDESPTLCPKCGDPTRQLFSIPVTFARTIDHPDSPLDDLPGAEKMRKMADYAINKTLKDMGR